MKPKNYVRNYFIKTYLIYLTKNKSETFIQCVCLKRINLKNALIKCLVEKRF